MSSYDIEKFEPPPDPDLVCCICQCVLDRAVECPCRHVFCQSCIERWLTNRHTCPSCRKKTRKQDLKPVLPLVQNMLNRLVMICEYRDNGCVEKVMLEHFERHIKNCGYEKKTCRFPKCGTSILRMHLEIHESEQCEHRESPCEGECGLMIPLSDRPSHNCVTALKAHIDEKNRMIEQLKVKLHELNNLSQSLNDQLVELRQQLNDRNLEISSISSDDDSSDSDITDFLSEDLSRDSFRDPWFDSAASNVSVDNLDNQVSNDNTNQDTNNRSEGSDVVEQVERTVVNSLFELSSRLERVRNQMRAVLNSQLVQDQNNLNDEVLIPSAALDAIRNTNSTENQSTVTQNTSATSQSQHNYNNNNLTSNHHNLSGTFNRPDRERDSTEFNESQYFTDDNNASHDTNSNTDTDDYHNFDVLDETSQDSETNAESDISDLNWISDSDSHHTPDNGSPAHSVGYDHNTRDSSDHESKPRSRYVSEHVILSQPPGSPSDSTGSFSSIPSTSSGPASPASTSSTPVHQDSPQASSWSRSPSHSQSSHTHREQSYSDFTSSPVSSPVSDQSPDRSGSDQSFSGFTDSTQRFSSPNTSPYLRSSTVGGSPNQESPRSTSLDGSTRISVDEKYSDRRRQRFRLWSSSPVSSPDSHKSTSSNKTHATSITDQSHQSPAHFNDLGSPVNTWKAGSEVTDHPGSDMSLVSSFDNSDWEDNDVSDKQCKTSDPRNVGWSHPSPSIDVADIHNVDTDKYVPAEATDSEFNASSIDKSGMDTVYDHDETVQNAQNDIEKTVNNKSDSIYTPSTNEVLKAKNSSVFQCEPDSTQNVAALSPYQPVPDMGEATRRVQLQRSGSDRPLILCVTDSENSEDSGSLKYITKRQWSTRNSKNLAEKAETFTRNMSESSSNRSRLASSSLDSGIFTETNSACNDKRNKKNTEKKRKSDQHSFRTESSDCKRRKLNESSQIRNRHYAVENANHPIEPDGGSKSCAKYDFRKIFYESNSNRDTRRSQTSGDIVQPNNNLPRSPVPPMHYGRQYAQDYMPSHRKHRTSSGSKVSNSNNDSNGQSLNVKIDLSLINYSGHISGESSSSTIPTAAVVRSTNITPISHSSTNFKRDPSHTSTRQYRNENVKSTSPKPEEPRRSTYRQHTLRSQRLEPHITSKSGNSASPSRTSNTARTGLSQDYPMTWQDNGDDDSSSTDNTWEPGTDCDDMDDTFSEEEEFDTDSSYEVQVPKCTAALLEEYGSDESDESWTLGME